MRDRRIAISITEGRTVRDLLYNGLLEYFLAADFEVTIFTEAVTVPGFVRRWTQAGVDFAPLYPCDPTPSRSRAFWIRRRLAERRRRMLLRGWLAAERRWLYSPNPVYLDRFKAEPPNLVLATHAHLHREWELISSAHALGIPTLGLVRSWDNVHKGIRSHPDRLAVWNEINRQEVIELEGYGPENVDAVGPPQFDPYFAPDTLWPREKLAAYFDLDPKRPILLYATLGNFLPEFDETAWMDVLVEELKTGAIESSPQIVCRLHPWSRLEHFQRYAEHPDVRLSYVDRYVPSLTWYMTKDDVVLMANMIHHADVVITPGSTVVLEAAIFDRPTLVPVFHPYQPERARQYFATWVMGKHFRRIEDLQLVPVVDRREDFVAVVNRCLQQPSWFREGRARLVRDYVQFTDGRSTERVASLALRVAEDQG